MRIFPQSSVGSCTDQIVVMATFYSLLSFMAVNGFEYSDPGSFDLVTNLPLELAIIILRTLSGKDLLNAACVNKKWLNICKSDSKLRQKIRRYIRQQRRAEIATRVYGTGRRTGHGNFSSRPAMTNIVNTVSITSFQKNRQPLEHSTSRYMPYRRETAFGPASVGASRHRNRNIDYKDSARFRIRM